MAFEFLTGRLQNNLKYFGGEQKFMLHQDVVKSFITLQSKAMRSGINLQIVSAYRSYEAQAKIWNDKVTGKRKIFDDQGQLVIPDELSEDELIDAICRFSAIPGASRHHWGTDLDIYDLNIKERTLVKLTEQEYQTDFEKLNLFLQDETSKENPNLLLPYDRDRGGIAVEPWHVSFQQVSSGFNDAYTIDIFKKNLTQSSFHLKDFIEDRLEEIFNRFVKNNLNSE
ncbi:M15 family metallopeptidase [Bacteriovoracaceae bacterium]|nr:M15 family metallopeptidase [Bacteriovoracaceae bacterium]